MRASHSFETSRSRALRIVYYASLLCCFLAATASLEAQTVSGTILGTIQDQQGAVIPKAEVTARNLETGAVRKINTDGNGNYRVPSVQAGTYEVSATANGFKTEVRTGVEVTVGGDSTVSFSLTVGAVTEKIEVSEAAAQVDTASSALGGFVGGAAIRELPLNGRDWLQLALLQPGVYMNTGQAQNDANRAQKGNGLAFSISGGRQSDNAYRIDGLIVNDYANAGPGSSLRVNMGVDAIREFSVLTNSFSAEYGRGAGGVVNAITKSGTNDFHGSAFYFHRNSALDARNFFDGTDPAKGEPRLPVFHRHQIGGALGGPIKKDKTFFFANYETLREMKGLSYSVDTISDAARGGTLCATADPRGNCITTTQVTVADSVKPYLALFPRANGPITGNSGKFVYGPPRLGNEDYVIGKMDHNFSPSTTLSGSYTYDNSKVNSPDFFNVRLVNAPTRRQNLVLNLQHIFTPSLISTSRVGFARTYGGNNIDTPINPALSNLALGFLPGQIMGSIVINGVSGRLDGIGALGINLFGHTAPQFYQDLAWTKGRHSLRVGFGFERLTSNIISAQSPGGTWTFGSIPTFLQAGQAVIFNGDLPGTDATRGQRNSVFAGYVQDDFRIRSNLTINLGVRYEMATVITEVNGKLSNLRNLYDAKSTIGNPYWNNPTLRNFAPRVGFAWDPFKTGKTSVRGGFGMFDILPLPYLLGGRIVRAPPFFLQANLQNPPPSTFPNKVAPLLNLSTLGATMMEFDPRRSYRMQWNLNIQRQLTRTMALTVGYVGSTGVHLVNLDEDADVVPPHLATFDSASSSYRFPATGTIQRINPNFGRIRATFWDAHSTYHSLQTNLVQRPVRGLTYQLAYTWAKSIDNGSVTYTASESSNTIGKAYFFCLPCNRGLSDFNIPHNFVANFLYDIPVLAAVKANRAANTILGGWQVGGIYTRQSGANFSLRLSSDRARTGTAAAGAATSGNERPMFVAAAGCNPNATTGNLNSYVNTSCFAFPALGQLGNLGRNTLTMPTFRNLDFSVFKNQNLFGEKLRAQLRIEMFNVTNTTNIQAQLRTMFDSAGNITSGFGTPAAPTVNTSRQIQFGMRLIF